LRHLAKDLAGILTSNSEIMEIFPQNMLVLEQEQQHRLPFGPPLSKPSEKIEGKR